MTYEETLGVMSVMKAAYPSYYKGMTRKDAEQAAGLWAEMFKDDSLIDVSVAVKAFIASDTKGFPPTIGVIKAELAKLREPDDITELEAWNIVRNAVSGASVSPQSVVWYNGSTDGRTSAQRRFDALPERIKRVVGSPKQLAEWAEMDTATLNSVVASNFQRSYKARRESDREYTMLPSDVRAAMQQIGDGMKFPELIGASNGTTA